MASKRREMDFVSSNPSRQTARVSFCPPNIPAGKEANFEQLPSSALGFQRKAWIPKPAKPKVDGHLILQTQTRKKNPPLPFA